MVESVFSIDVLEEIIEKSDLPNRGAYTAVGTYDHQ
ncbi:heme NO-binding domain-containing protein [Paraglaciecola arctica]|nr:heme NO-binding domain-containing protein [Paraglaciecola arctica]